MTACHKKESTIMTMNHKKESIHYDNVPHEGEYPLWYCATRRRVFIMTLYHKKSAHYGAVSQEGKYLLWLCITKR